MCSTLRVHFYVLYVEYNDAATVGYYVMKKVYVKRLALLYDCVE